MDRVTIAVFLRDMCRVLYPNNQSRIRFLTEASLRLLDALVGRVCDAGKSDEFVDWFSIENLACLSAACLSLAIHLYKAEVPDYCRLIGQMTHVRYGRQCNMRQLRDKILRVVA